MQREYTRLTWSLLIVLLLFSSCNRYEKILKSPDANLQYHEAVRYYHKGKYHKAKPLFERIIGLVKATSRADSVHYFLANCYFQESEYALAGYSFEQFTQNYPKSPFVEEATFMAAYCHYLDSPRPTLDQTSTQNAIASFYLFKELYPNSERNGEVDGYLKELHGKLLKKSYLSARQYYHRRQYKAAVAALKHSLEKYPTGPYREEQLFLVLKSSFLYAEKSIPSKRRERYQMAVDAYLSFYSEFPDSGHSKEAATYYRRAMQYLGNTPDESVLPGA